MRGQSRRARPGQGRHGLRRLSPRRNGRSTNALGERRFGDAGRQVVVEELLTGPEVSVFGLSDGRNVRTAGPRPRLQAHLRRRPRTQHRWHGGGRAAAGRGLEAVLEEVSRTVLDPCIAGAARAGESICRLSLRGPDAHPRRCARARVQRSFRRPGDAGGVAAARGVAARHAHRVRPGEVAAGVARARPGAAVGVVAAAAGYPGDVRRGDVDHRHRRARRRCPLFSRRNARDRRRHAADRRRPRALRHRDRTPTSKPRGHARMAILRACTSTACRRAAISGDPSRQGRARDRTGARRHRGGQRVRPPRDEHVRRGARRLRDRMGDRRHVGAPRRRRGARLCARRARTRVCECSSPAPAPPRTFPGCLRR